ncbi:hypothetical protein [Phyllobacterium salinisoli]|nr:hypothetical protein [Phyllobacterium salinisoli]
MLTKPLPELSDFGRLEPKVCDSVCAVQIVQKLVEAMMSSIRSLHPDALDRDEENMICFALNQASAAVGNMSNDYYSALETDFRTKRAA